ncbi:MAG: hypothetical protein JSS53_01230 [Proteobacteria bacterium]|nr:hypothetical protein [Pseudomonadota bacterium]
MPTPKKTLERVKNTLGFLQNQDDFTPKNPLHTFFIHSVGYFKLQCFLRFFNLYKIDFDLFNLLCAYSELLESKATHKKSDSGKEERFFAYHGMDEIFKSQKVNENISKALGIDSDITIQSCIQKYAQSDENDQKKYLTALVLGLFQGFIEYGEVVDKEKYKASIKKYIRKHNLQFTVISTKKALVKHIELTDPDSSFLIYDREAEKSLERKQMFRRFLKLSAVFTARFSVMVYSLILAVTLVFGLASILGISLVSFGSPLAILAVVGLVAVGVISFFGFYNMYSTSAINTVRDIFRLWKDLTPLQMTVFLVLALSAFSMALVTSVILGIGLVAALSGVGLPFVAAVAISVSLGIIGCVGFSLVMLQVVKRAVVFAGSKLKILHDLLNWPDNEENTKGLKRIWQVTWHYLKAAIIISIVLLMLGLGCWAIYLMFAHPWFQGLVGSLHATLVTIMPFAPSGMLIAVSIVVWAVAVGGLIGRAIYNLNPLYSFGIYTGKVITRGLEIGASIALGTLNIMRDPRSIPEKIDNAYHIVKDTVIMTLRHPLDVLFTPMRKAINRIWGAFLVGVPNVGGIVVGLSGHPGDVVTRTTEETLRNAIDSIEKIFRQKIHALAQGHIKVDKEVDSIKTVAASSAVGVVSTESETSSPKKFSLFTLKKTEIPSSANDEDKDSEGEGEKKEEKISGIDHRNP